MNPLGDLWDFITQPFDGLSSWAGDQIFAGITNWIARGVVQLLAFVWQVMDTSSSPRLGAEWFAGGETSPYVVAMRIGAVLLLTVFLVAVAYGIAVGDVGGILRRTVADLPLTVFAMVALTTITQAALGLADSISATVWEGTRTNAVTVFDGLGQIATNLTAGSFLAPLVLLVLMAALLMLWLVLFIRDALIYLVVVLAVAFGLPGMVWQALRGMTRHTLELLAALVIAKPVIALAMSVGVGALGGVGATGTPGDSTVGNGLAEFGTLVVGIICFGLAAFMPYLVYRLLPVAVAATVAHGIAQGPLRAASTGMQFQYYAQSTFNRLSGGGGGGSSFGASDLGGSADIGSTTAGAGSTLAGTASTTSAASTGGAAATAGAATGPAAPVVMPVLAVTASAARAAASTVQQAASNSVDTAASAPQQLSLDGDGD